jgi:hypothetical protein
MSERRNRIGSVFLALVGALGALAAFGQRNWLQLLLFVPFSIGCLVFAIRGRLSLLPHAEEQQPDVLFSDEKAIADAQAITHYTIDGKRFARIRCGDEVAWEADWCSDCGVSRRQFHIPGCDLEECPKSHRQAITSPHKIAEFQA